MAMDELWIGEYDPRSPGGVVRFLAESVLALGLILRGACHVHGVFWYHRDRDGDAAAEMDARYRLVRFSVERPAVSARQELIIRLATAWLGTVIALSLAEFVGAGLQNPLAALFVIGNYGVLALDPVWWALQKPDQIRLTISKVSPI